MGVLPSGEQSSSVPYEPQDHEKSSQHEERPGQGCGHVVMPRGWLLLLWVFLFTWEPLRFAMEVSASIGTLGMRGAAGAVELAVHGGTAALTMAAAWALWIRNPAAPALASLGVAASAAVTIQSVYWSHLPVDVPPGLQLPRAVIAAVHAGLWIWYLQTSRRVRALHE